MPDLTERQLSILLELAAHFSCEAGELGETHAPAVSLAASRFIRFANFDAYVLQVDVISRDRLIQEARDLAAYISTLAK